MEEGWSVRPHPPIAGNTLSQAGVGRAVEGALLPEKGGVAACRP